MGIRRIRLTTNGSLLERKAAALKQAGLQSMNVSLDAVDEAVFVRMSRRNSVERVIRGIDAALDAGLAKYAAGRRGILQSIRQALIVTSPLRKCPGGDRSRYDRFMLGFHDFLKMNVDFQASCPKERFEFPPGSTWVAFTDAVPHAVVSGQCALEQTFFLPVGAMLCPRKSPLRILEAIAGSSLV